MRFLLATLLTGLLAYFAGLLLPWWVLAVIAFAVAALLPQRLLPAFLSGFLGVFLMWSFVAAWIDIKNGSLLSHKIAQLLPLGGSSVLLVLVSALVGGLVGGFAAMSGASLRQPAR
ncbi:hypothetical protein SAMN05444008_116106 [Cnuella takakiae]|uniref:Uncharacterized protein n=1 Tax=Cnuella takakiae TaxID=1302690 RepID=A0A1M5GJN4_9BACT|nr:hypothetical protein [Cnuella takakiae]OLY92441.1 hypothetical protein BUE76_11495 [Cnuella takakiae]SHG03903.1 hypothetical protein SAMN05444008_116106 [Cnuella takakiae]